VINMRATIKLHRFVLNEIVKHANKKSEFECCGFLIGNKILKDDELIIQVDGIYHDWKVGTEDHCVFSPLTLYKACEYAKQLQNGRTVIGNYHSHGMYPAEFSPVDRQMQLQWADNKCTLIYSPQHNHIVGEIITRGKEAIPARITLYGERTDELPYVNMAKNSNDSSSRLL